MERKVGPPRGNLGHFVGPFIMYWTIHGVAITSESAKAGDEALGVIPFGEIPGLIAYLQRMHAEGQEGP